jgi:hypothetical protein
VNDRTCDFRYIRRDDGLHEQRHRCNLVVDPGINDVSQLLLQFAPATLPRYEFHRAGLDYTVGPKCAVVFRYQQRAGYSGLTVRDGKKVEHRPVTGRVFVAVDGSDVFRVTLDATEPNNVRSYAQVDYRSDADGATIPTAVLYQEFQADVLIAETAAIYTRAPGVRR